MTRKDYEKAARKLLSLNLSLQARSQCAAILSAVFEDDNPRFDRRRFFMACEASGFGSGVESVCGNGCREYCRNPHQHSPKAETVADSLQALDACLFVKGGR